MAQLEFQFDFYEGNLPVPWAPTSRSFTYNCELPIFDPPIIGGISVEVSGNTNGNFSASLTGEAATTPEQLAENALREQIENFLPDLPCTFGITEDLGVLRGSFNLYSFSVGGGFSGGFEVNRRASAVMTFADTIEITSPVSQTIALPISISGSVLAAESFGDPDRTRGTATLRLFGTVGSQSLNEEVSVESISVIPATADINVTSTAMIDLSPGLNVITVAIEGRAEAQAIAVSAGFFGTLAGATTVSVDFPNSIRVKTFRAANGGPLPAGITIRSRGLNRIIQSSGPGPCDPPCTPCDYDFNQDENIDLTDAQQMAQVFVGLLSPEPTWLDGDLNADENADLTDAQLLAAYVVTGLCGV